MKENIDFLSKYFDYKVHQKLLRSDIRTSKRQLIFEKLGNCTFSVKWCLKSSFLPLIGKLLPSDTIQITKWDNRVAIKFTVNEVKKLYFTRRPTTILFDFSVQDKDSLTAYNIYLIDEKTHKYCCLNSKFTLDEKKMILTAMITNQKKRLKQTDNIFADRRFVKRKQLGGGAIR